MLRTFLMLLFIFLSSLLRAQSKIDSFKIYHDVKITVDAPVHYKNKKTVLVLFALPNGNTTAQTMGKKFLSGDDWHFDIQHIKAQTTFIRHQLKQNIVLVYLENTYRSWPLWKQKHTNYKQEIQHIVDTIFNSITSKNKIIYLIAHSGGGSFIFGYLDGTEQISPAVERISFIDSNYNYDSSYYTKFKNWLHQNKKATLTVFAYNDSIALYNGKSIVSEKGGTWYRSHLMIEHFQKDFVIQQIRNDSLIFYKSKDEKIAFFLKANPERKIYHTVQVELNGFIHSILYGTKKENSGYEYYGHRAYSKFIE